MKLSISPSTSVLVFPPSPSSHVSPKTRSPTGPSPPTAHVRAEEAKLLPPHPPTLPPGVQPHQPQQNSHSHISERGERGPAFRILPMMGNLSAPFACVERETNLLLLSNLVKHPILAYLLFFLFLLFLPPPVDKGESLRRAMSPVMSRRGERVCCGKGRIGGAIRGAGYENRQQVYSNLHAQ